MASEKLDTKRKLTNEQTPKSEGTMIVGGPQSFFRPGKLKSNDISKGVIQYLHQGKYEQLKQELSSLGFLETDKMAKFFLREGSAILGWTLMSAPSDEPLRFLADKNSIVPKDILQTALKQEDFLAFQTFLYAEVGLDEAKKLTPELRKIRVEKFKALLDIDSEAIIGFMERNQYFQIGSVKEDFEIAKRFVEENTVTSKSGFKM